MLKLGVGCQELKIQAVSEHQVRSSPMWLLTQQLTGKLRHGRKGNRRKRTFTCQIIPIGALCAFIDRRMAMMVASA